MSIASLHETRILTGRSMRHILRSPDTIITTAVTPVAMLLLFAYVFGGAINTQTTEPYVNYLLPGILIITIASGVAYTSYRLFLDVRDGLVQRLRAMPISRSSVLWSHVATSLISNLVSMALVLAVALIMGFRTSASFAQWLAVIGLLCLVTLSMTWIAVLAGLSAKSVDGASAFSYPLIFLPLSHQHSCPPIPCRLRWHGLQSTSRSPQSSSPSEPCWRRSQWEPISRSPWLGSLPSHC